MRRMWLDRLPELLETSRTHPEAVLWRSDVEKLFDVSKESALQIMRTATITLEWKPTKAHAVQSRDILRLLEQIPECSATASPLDRRKWVKMANAFFAQLIANPNKSKAGTNHKFPVQTGTTPVPIPVELADIARSAAGDEGISLGEWVATAIAREVKRSARSRRQRVQDELSLFP